MDDSERRAVIAAARATVERLQRQERSEAVSEARSRVAGWTPKPTEPPQRERQIDTAVSAAQVRAMLRDDRREIFAVIEELVASLETAFENGERALAKERAERTRLEAEVAKVEARLARQIVRALTPEPTSSSSGVTDASSPLQGRSSRRVN